MFTVCPRCALTLAVTADDLRAGQGYVRCGRCLNVFNALMALSEESPAPESQPPAACLQADPASSSQISRALESADPAAATVSAPPALAALPEADSTEEPHEREILVESDTEPPAELADESLTALPLEPQNEPLLAPEAQLPGEVAHHQLATEVSGDGAFENESSLAEGTGTFETIVLEGDAITQTEEFAPQESVDREIAALTQRLHAQPAQVPAPAGAADVAAAVTESEQPELDDSEAGLASLGLGTSRQHIESPHHRRAWLAGCILLALLLILQALNHWRDSLASIPSLSTPMTQLYKSLGVPLDPHWDLNAYDIRQQGAVADPTDSHLIRVRLSVANHAARAQPVPLLRLTLLDRYGKRIAARDLAPEDYWPRGQAPHHFLAHDERIDSEVIVRDQGPDSASFELDVCLRNIHGVIACAGDISPAAAGTT